MAAAETEEAATSAAETVNADIATICLNSVEIENARSVGCERLALSSLDALGFRDILRDVGLSDRDARIAMALVIARMVHPASERETLRWLETNSAALELLHLDTGQGHSSSTSSIALAIVSSSTIGRLRTRCLTVSARCSVGPAR